MRSYKVEGVILSRSNFSEADKIVTIFTRQLGRIKVLAKGIRRIQSRRAPHLELFNQVELVLHAGKTFDTITEAHVIDSFSLAKLKLKLSGFLFYLAEVIDKILPEHQPHLTLYKTLVSSIKILSASPNPQSVVKEFVVQLLWDLGYLPKGQYPKLGITDFVESVVEKRIRSRKFLEEIE